MSGFSKHVVLLSELCALGCISACSHVGTHPDIASMQMGTAVSKVKGGFSCRKLFETKPKMICKHEYVENHLMAASLSPSIFFLVLGIEPTTSHNSA